MERETSMGSGAAEAQPGESHSTGPQGTGSPSVATAFHILDRLAEAGRPLSMAEIARDMSLPKSSVSRILASLEGQGVVQREAVHKRYSIGAKLRDYAIAVPESDLVADFQEIAGPVARSIDETVQLGALMSNNVTFLSIINSSQPVRLVSFVGRTLPAHATATGKAVLAFSAADTVETVIRAGLAPITDQTITDPEIFRAELRAVRARGYATENEESASNLSCVAAPVFRGDSVVAAVTACIPQAMIPSRKIPLVTQAILDISSQLSTH